MPGTSRRGRLRRTWPQRGLIAFNICCIVAALVGAATLTYAKQKVNQINRVRLSDVFKGSDDLGDKDPRNFLIVGVDDDSGLSGDDPASQGRGNVGGLRSDTLMIVRLDPKTTGAQVLSLPRDLWVDIPGRSRNRINSALQYGGQDLLISTIKQDFGIDINHYVQVNFKAFKSLVNLIDGVPIYFPTPVRDQGGLNVEHPGCTKLDENGALAYVRARHFQYQNDRGRWVSDPTSDYGRISRQQDFIRRVIRRSDQQGRRNPLKLRAFVDVAVRNITLDGSTTPKDLVDLGVAFRNFDPGALQTFTIPTTEVVRGGAQVLDVREVEAEPILARFRGTLSGSDPAGEISPSTVVVKVLNGTNTRNQASSTSDLLRQVGFKLEPPGQAPSQAARTEIRYPPGQEAQAALVGRYLFAQPLLVAEPGASVITLVTGPDFGTVLKSPRPVGDVPVPTTSTTSTTVPVSTTAPIATTVTPEVPGATTTTRPGYVPGDPPAGVDCG